MNQSVYKISQLYSLPANESDFNCIWHHLNVALSRFLGFLGRCKLRNLRYTLGIQFCFVHFALSTRDFSSLSDRSLPLAFSLVDALIRVARCCVRDGAMEIEMRIHDENGTSVSFWKTSIDRD